MKAKDTHEALDAEGPAFVKVPLEPGAGQIECAVYPPLSLGSGTEPESGLIVHLYGSSGSCRTYNLMRPPYATLRRLLRERGFWLVVPDLGGSHWMNAPACRALDAVIDAWIHEHGVHPGRVHLLGTSMGGGSGLIYIARRPTRIRSMCALFPMTDFAQWMQERPGYLSAILRSHNVPPSASAALLHDLSPIRHLDAYAQLPLFLLHGDRDPVVPVHHSREFAAALRGQGAPVTYHEVHGFGHDDAIAEAYQKKMADFLTEEHPAHDG